MCSNFQDHLRFHFISPAEEKNVFDDSYFVVSHEALLIVKKIINKTALGRRYATFLWSHKPSSMSLLNRDEPYDDYRYRRADLSCSSRIFLCNSLSSGNPSNTGLQDVAQ